MDELLKHLISFVPKDILPYLLWYAIGSLPTSVILSNLFGFDDPRKSGSGNIGFSNTLRTSQNKIFPIAVGLIDISKGFFSFVDFGLYGVLSCLVGNTFSWFPKSSGKGVSVLIGGLIGLNSYNLLLIPVWFAVTKLTYPSISSLIIMIYSFFYGWVFYITGLIILFKHCDNIKRLFKKDEKKI